MSTDHGEEKADPGAGPGGESPEIDLVSDVGPFLTFDDSSATSLPPVSQESLQLCCRFLSEKLTYPFEAFSSLQGGDGSNLPSELLVLALIEPGENWRTDGILCRALHEGQTIELPLKDILVRGKSETRRMLEGYVEWFRDSQNRPAEIVPFRQRVFTYSAKAPLQLPIGKAILVTCSAGALFGFLLGSLLGAVELARISAILVAALFGTLGMIGAYRIRARARINAPSFWRRLTTILYIGLVTACIGGLAGAMVIAFLGIFCGAIAGGLLGSMVKGGAQGIGLGILIGSILGPVILAFTIDRAGALYWGLQAAWVGAALGGILVLLGVNTIRHGEAPQ